MSKESQVARFEQLRSMLNRQRIKGRWLVLMHDNPDPDAIAAAAALSLLLREGFGHSVTAAYGGLIGRAENREMVRALGIRMSHVRHLKWSNYRRFALVDTQPRTGNNQLPQRIVPDLVFDHHPARRASAQARFVDIRPEYGATATLMAEYLAAADVPISRKLSTALIYAIRTETQDFRREFVQADKALHDSARGQGNAICLHNFPGTDCNVPYRHGSIVWVSDLERFGALGQMSQLEKAVFAVDCPRLAGKEML